MRTIYKYPLDTPIGKPIPQELLMPSGAKVIHVGQQNGYVCLWAEIETDAPEEKVIVYAVGTGREIPAGLQHVGSVAIHNGMLPVHIYM